MRQYHDIIEHVLQYGCKKPSARENMPGTTHVFGHQVRFDLSKGFPLVNTKKMFWKGIVAELLWILRGDTHIQFLHDHGAHFWDQDAYRFYLEKVKEFTEMHNGEPPIQILKDSPEDKKLRPYTLAEFTDMITYMKVENLPRYGWYVLGDTGKQYPWLWRNWSHSGYWLNGNRPMTFDIDNDQFKSLIVGLKESPYGRRHIITAWNPLTLDEMALEPCHAFVQFNCRPLSERERNEYFFNMIDDAMAREIETNYSKKTVLEAMDGLGVPTMKLDCQMYQRSADLILGVPFNIASYALLTHLVAKMVNMVPGDYVHTFGDLHIYDNHMEAAHEQLTREPYDLCKLEVLKGTDKLAKYKDNSNLDDFINSLEVHDFKLIDFVCHPKLEAEAKLSTGL